MKKIKGDLRSMAMTVQVESTCYSGRKLGKKETQSLIDSIGCADDAVRVNKFIIPKDIIDGPIKARLEAYQLRDRLSVPWTANGVGLVRADQIEIFQTKMGELERKFWKDVDYMIERYEIFFDALYQNGSERMGSSFDESDYPTPSELRAKYRFKIHYGNLADSKDWRVNLPKEKLQELAVAASEREKDLIHQGIRAAWERLYKVVSHMAERINFGPDDDKKIFRDTLTGNIAELCEILPLLNITGDPDLEQVGKEIYDKLATADPAMLREDHVYRKKAKDEADEILEKMKGLF